MKELSNRHRTVIEYKNIQYSIESKTDENGEDKIVVMKKNKITWEVIPINLTVRSWFSAAIRDDLWPSTTYDDFYFDNEKGLCIRFHEKMPFYTIRPKSVQHPCKWLACYNERIKKWELHKGHFLNIEGEGPYYIDHPDCPNM